MVIENQELCEYIKEKGRKIANIRAMDIYATQLTVGEIGDKFNAISTPNLTAIINRLKIRGYIYSVTAIAGKKLYHSIHIYQKKTDIECLVLSTWSYKTKGWIIDFGSFLQLVQNRIPRFGIEKISYRVRSYSQYFKAMKYIFKTCGWETDYVLQHLYYMDDLSPLLEIRWLNRPIIPGCSIVPLTIDNLQVLKSTLEGEEWKSIREGTLYPFGIDHPIEYDFSFILYYNDKMVGWLVSHRMRKDMFQVTSLYVDEPSCGWMGLRMLSEGKRNLDKASKHMDKASFIVTKKNIKMFTALKKILVPFGLREESLNEFYKTYNPISR